MMNEIPPMSLTCDYRFAVVDSTVTELLPEEIIAKPIVPKCLAQSAHLMPRLIDLHSLSTDQRELFRAFLSRTSDGFQTACPAILVATSSGAHEFARHWNTLQLPTPTSRYKFWLRIHDARVLHQLLRILSPMQRLGLFGPVHAFHYWLGNEWTSALRNLPGGVSRLIASIKPLGWDWQRIEHISIINRALQNAALYDLSLLTTQSALAERLIERAITNHGLSTKADLIEYTTRGLIYGPLFDKDSRIAAAIKESSSPDCANLSDRFALIDDAVWASLHKFLSSCPTEQI